MKLDPHICPILRREETHFEKAPCLIIFGPKAFQDKFNMSDHKWARRYRCHIQYEDLSMPVRVERQVLIIIATYIVPLSWVLSSWPRLRASHHDVPVARSNPLYGHVAKNQGPECNIRTQRPTGGRGPKGPKSTNLGSSLYRDIRGSCTDPDVHMHNGSWTVVWSYIVEERFLVAWGIWWKGRSVTDSLRWLCGSIKVMQLSNNSQQDHTDTRDV